MLTNAQCEGIRAKELVITVDGKNETIEADTVVLAVGARPKTDLFKALEGKVPEIYLAGDCVEPRNIGGATEDGSRIARMI